VNAPACPICKSLSISLVFSISVERLILEWQRLYGIDISAETGDIQSTDLFECSDCHVRFFKPDRLAGSFALYAHLEKFDWYYMPWKWEHDMAINDLRGCRTVLEIGCGLGDFVARAGTLGWIAEGIDLNDSAIATARGRGLPVRRLDLQEAARTHRSCYDAVCSFQVLEHVPNPREFLESSCELLKPGGKLVLGVPNADSFIKHQINLLDMPPHHMTRWPVRAMAALPKWFPLRLEHIQREPLAKYHVNGYVEAQGAAWFRSRLLHKGYAAFLAAPFAAILKHTSLREHIIGQTLYACFVRV
jgi:SAM-dependent methyltransferase